MKLAEALQERADLNRRLEQLRVRLCNNATVQEGEKPAGRWYYSGGDLVEPDVEYVDISAADLAAEYGDQALIFYPPGKQIAVVNGIRTDVREQEDVREQVQRGNAGGTDEVGTPAGG